MSLLLEQSAPKTVPFDPAKSFNFHDPQDVDNRPGNLRAPENMTSQTQALNFKKRLN